MTLNPSTGAITGTPTATGTANFTVRVADSLGISASKALSIEVVDHPDITTTSLAAVTVGQSVSTAVAATNGTTPYTWSVSTGALPAGLTLNPSTGAITGTPTGAETASFTVKVTDAHSLEDTQALSWTVNAAPSITTSSLPETTVTAAYSQTLSAHRRDRIAHLVDRIGRAAGGAESQSVDRRHHRHVDRFRDRELHGADHRCELRDGRSGARRSSSTPRRR